MGYVVAVARRRVTVRWLGMAADGGAAAVSAEGAPWKQDWMVRNPFF